MAHIDFLADLEEIVSQELSQMGFTPSPGEDIQTLLLRYINLKRRIPPVIPWTVKKSQDLINKSLSSTISNGLQQFITKAESGQNLKPHISTRINDPDYPDLMFYDWEVFHFHLGINPHPTQPGFIERTDPVLFALADVNSATMYLLDTHPHEGGFTNQDLLRIIEDNWPEILDPCTAPDVDEIDQIPSDEDIGSFRKARVVTLIKTPGGRVLLPMGLGITTDGTSVQNLMIADEIKTNVSKLQQQLIQNKETWEIQFKEKHGREWDDLHFKLISFEPLGIKELTTDKFFAVNREQ